MLHAQRRNAVWGAIFKVVLWAGFIIVPLYLYMQYLAPVMQSALDTMQRVQQVGGSAQGQLNSAQDALKKLQDQLNALVPKKP